MYVVDSITANAKQKQNISIADGTSITIQLEYKPQQLGWFISKLEHQGFELSNIRICTSPNLLHQFKNKIPFGIAVVSKNNFEPTQQEDFSLKNSVMYILTEAEADSYLSVLQSG